MQDPDLLGELGEMTGGVAFGKNGSHGALSVGGERGRGGQRGEQEPNDEDTVEPDVEGDDDFDALGDLVNDDDAREVLSEPVFVCRTFVLPFWTRCFSSPSTLPPPPPKKIL